MDITGKTIWQQASGDTNRNYGHVCLEWDVILNGPGYAGAYPACEDTLRQDGVSSRKRTDLWRFAQEIKDGDLVVLRLGTSRIIGVGQIKGDYQWLEMFADVDGWDLQHVRRVQWLWKGTQDFSTYTMKLGDTTQRLDSPDVTKWLESLEVTQPHEPRTLDLETQAQKATSIETIAEYLFDQGVASRAISDLTHEISELIRIAKWYHRAKNPSEHETTAYLVVPLLRALGWTPQRMAIEWNAIDVALFETLPREGKNLNTVVEVKRFNTSSLIALEQAESYAKHYEHAQRIILTDGIRYSVYIKQNQGFKPYAYLNLLDMRDGYAIYDCLGAEDALLAMVPYWKPINQS